MNGSTKLLAPLVAATALAACNAGGSSIVPGAPGQNASLLRLPASAPRWMANGLAKPACPMVTGVPTCLALIESKGGLRPDIAGLAPIDFQTRYNLPSSTNGSGQIVAIVDAHDNPKVASDLATYRTQFGLGTANFTKYNQDGQTSNYPTGNTGWGVEIDLDVEMVSAACPLCTIYLIEAKHSRNRDLEAAEVTAVKLGAHIVSNSWICYGKNSCVKKRDFDQPGVVYTAGSGDVGYNDNGNPESRTRSFRSEAPGSRRAARTIARAFGTAPAADARTTEAEPAYQSLHGKKIQIVRIAPMPTSRRSPTTSPSTIPTVGAAGLRWAERASRRR
ncbi:MAG: hypothetical protein WAK15_11720 [Candidatus Cybelea sp.]